MREILFGICCFCTVGSLYTGESLDRLMDGNQRYVKDLLEHPNRTSERREALTTSQSPFAIIVGCSDSRVAPEIIFDQGVGDLFVVRVAGNVIGPLELSSVEYSAKYLNSKVILVLGHERCGAIQAVVSGQTESIQPIADIIAPAIKEVEQEHPKDLLDACIQTNAVRMKQILLQSPVIQNLVEKKQIEVHAAYYDLHTGEVRLLDAKKVLAQEPPSSAFKTSMKAD
jgi:carbonic anhydrase